MWWKSSFLLVVLVVSCTSQQHSNKRNASEIIPTAAIDTLQNEVDSSGVSLWISIPKNSGLAFVDYMIYVFENDTLYKLDQKRLVSLDTSIHEQFVYDTLDVFPLGPQKTNELRSLIAQTDSLGNHHADGCLFQYGWPRFFISTYLDGESMNGFLTNCYREHIFRFVDFLNECYPKGNVISYTRKDLIQTEKDCEANNYGRGK